MVKKEPTRVKENLHGCTGPVYFHDILTKDELMGHANLFGHIVIPPQSGIGWHVHQHETEPYFILKGHGIFTNPDGSEVEVSEGDVCTIEVGEGHAIRNASETEDLEFIALIVKEG